MTHLDIKISGRVQGLFFRHSVKEKTEKFCLKGFVRNQSDGSVYVEVEGEESNLRKFVKWSRRGPVSTEVTGVEIKEGKLKNFEEFVILPDG